MFLCEKWHTVKASFYLRDDSPSIKFWIHKLFHFFRPPKIYINSAWPMTQLGRRNILKFGLIFHFYTFYLNDHHIFRFQKLLFLAKLCSVKMTYFINNSATTDPAVWVFWVSEWAVRRKPGRAPLLSDKTGYTSTRTPPPPPSLPFPHTA